MVCVLPPNSTSKLWRRLSIAPEVAAIRARVAEPRDGRLGGLPVLEGRLGGKAVVVVTTGISMVNAAMNAQRAIDRYAPRLVVFSGIAGGVDPALGIGDVVVAAQWAQYLEASFARERAGGAPGKAIGSANATQPGIAASALDEAATAMTAMTRPGTDT